MSLEAIFRPILLQLCDRVTDSVGYLHSRICLRWHRRSHRQRCTSCPRWSRAWGGGRCLWGRCQSRWRRLEAWGQRSFGRMGWRSRRLPPTPNRSRPTPTEQSRCQNDREPMMMLYVEMTNKQEGGWGSRNPKNVNNLKQWQSWC